MKKLILVAVGAALVAGLAASLQPTEAACGSPRTILSVTQTGGTYLYTPGGPHQGAAFPDAALNDPRGQFWSVGNGNPVSGAPPNNDSGSRSGETNFYPGPGSSNWLENGYDGFGAYIADFYGGSHWNYPGTDGCVDFDGTVTTETPDPNQCTAVLIDDDDDNGGGFFIFAAQAPNATANYNFNEAFGDVGSNGSADLVPIPRPNITGSASLGTNTKQVTVTVPCPIGPAGGVYSACSPAQPENAALVGPGRTGYRLYQVTTPPNVLLNGVDSRDLPSTLPEDDDGNPSNWAAFDMDGAGPLTVGSSAVCGQPVTFTVTCTADAWIHLCASLVFDDDPDTGAFDPEWETSNCSADAVPIGCGPTMVDFPTEEPTIKRKPSTDDRRPTERERPTRGR
jgi:hypothetical protein